ncbi:hypothetical protein [Paenibacillus kandeliae]|uniref:hypothetical protein n=1 Tax=Paenibacillus kandeliae TaxID=3231269 RepID=UPI00345ADBAE
MYGPIYVTSNGLNKLYNEHYTIQTEEVFDRNTGESAIAVYFEEYIEYDEAMDLLKDSGGFSNIVPEDEEDEEDEEEEEYEDEDEDEDYINHN